MAGADTVRTPKKEGGDAIDKTSPIFTIDDLLAELRPEDVDGGLTIRELCEQAGLVLTDSNMAKVRRKVNNLRARGLWEYTGQKELPNITGAPRGRAAFRPVSQEGGDVE